MKQPTPPQAARNLFDKASAEGKENKEKAINNAIILTESATRTETASEIYDFIYENGVKNSMSLGQLMDTFEKTFSIKKKHDFSREPAERRN